ncbi:MAG: hypothetical protein DRJ40_07555 [Thermoprotei archaeon]|nr:MAG: hypothetical protein DRJ40_07555 [Thermoprotei archaeon]
MYLMLRGGWWSRGLFIDLSEMKWRVFELDRGLVASFLGGRGLALHYLYSLQEPKVSALAPNSLIVIATSPLSGIPIFGTRTAVIAVKSFSTDTYVDADVPSPIGTALKQCGYDIVVVRGRCEKPCTLYIREDGVFFEDATDLWNLGARSALLKLIHDFGTEAAITIGVAGTKLVHGATVVTKLGPVQGPDIGAVMGSKNLKAIVIDGVKELPIANVSALEKVISRYLEYVKATPELSEWIRAGSVKLLELLWKHSLIPSEYFRDVYVDDLGELSPEHIEKFYKVYSVACPLCPLSCFSLCTVREDKYVGTWSYLDLAHVLALGFNCGIDRLGDVLYIAKLCSDYGIDIMTLGNVAGFTMMCYEYGIIRRVHTGGIAIKFGRADAVAKLLELICERRDIGEYLAHGVDYAAQKLGDYAKSIAMTVKGMELPALEMRIVPEIALLLSTSSTYPDYREALYLLLQKRFHEITVSDVVSARTTVNVLKCLSSCPLVPALLKLGLDEYSEVLKYVTGLEIPSNDLLATGIRVEVMLRRYFLREVPEWSPEFDYPPPRVFEEEVSKEPFRGRVLRRDEYQVLLKTYYREFELDECGKPRRELP